MRTLILLLALTATSTIAGEFYIGTIKSGGFFETPTPYKRYSMELDQNFTPDSTRTSLDFEEHNVMNIDVLAPGTKVLIELDNDRAHIMATDTLFDYVATRDVFKNMFSTELSQQLKKHKHRLRGYVIVTITSQHGRWNLKLDRHTSTNQMGELLVKTYARRTLSKFHQHLPEVFEMSLKVYFPTGNVTTAE